MQFYNFEDINRGPSWIAKAIPVNVKTHGNTVFASCGKCEEDRCSERNFLLLQKHSGSGCQKYGLN